MNRIYTLALFLALSCLGIACGETTNTTTANTTHVTNTANENMASNANTATPVRPRSIKEAQDLLHEQENAIMTNAKIRGNESLERQKARADEENDKLRRRIEELKNSNK